MSNSKLNFDQKRFRKAFMQDNPEVVFYSFPEYLVVVAIRQRGTNMGEYSVSIASNTEEKFRRKVGEFYAAERMHMGQVLPVVLHGFEADIVRKIAWAVSGN